MQEKAIRFQREYLWRKLRASVLRELRWRIGTLQALCIYGSGTADYTALVASLCRTSFPAAGIDLIVQSEKAKTVQRESNNDFGIIPVNDPLDRGALAEATTGKRFDLVLVLLGDRFAKGDGGSIKAARGLPSRHHLLVDSNMDVARSLSGIWRRVVSRGLRRKTVQYRSSPRRVISDLRRLFA